MTAPLPELRALWRPEQFNRVTNPGFETDTTGWSVSAGINEVATSITRITTDAHSGSACGSLVTGAGEGQGVNFDLGSDRYFAEASYGAIYIGVAWLKLSAGSGRARMILGSEGTSADRATTRIDLVEDWRPYVVRWMPSADRTDAQLAISNDTALTATILIDDVAVYQMDAFSQCENGTFETDTTGWSVSAGLIAAAATSITRTAGGFGGSYCGRIVTSAASALSGATYDLGTRRFISGRTYRLRVAARSESGLTSARLALGNASDNELESITLTSSFEWYTCDWTPAADRTDVELAVLNATAASRTIDIDEVEVYEAHDDLGTDVGSMLTWNRSLDGPGTLTASVRNHDGTYDPRYASGPLYGSLMPGKRLMARATYANALYPLFYGTIRALVAQPFGGVHATILAEDILGDLSRAAISHEFSATATYASARQATIHQLMAGLSAVGETTVAASSRCDLTSGSIEGNTFYNVTDGTTNALDYLRQLNDATGSAHRIEPVVHANIGWRYATAHRGTMTDTSSVDWTIDEDFEGIDGISVSAETMENRQEVPWQAYTKLPPPDHAAGYGIIATAYDPDVYGGDGSGDEPYLTYTRDEYGSDADTPESRFVYFVNGAWRQRGRIDRKERKKKGIKLKRGSRIYPDALVPVATDSGTYTKTLVIDFTVPIADAAVELGGDGAQNVNARLLESRPQRIIVDIYPDGDTVVSPADLERIDILGTPWTPLDELVEVRHGSSYDPLLPPYDGPGFFTPYIPAKGDAQGLGDYRNWRYGQSRLTPTLTSHMTFPRDLTIELLAKVRLSADRWRIDAVDFLVVGLRWEVRSGGLDWRSVAALEEIPEHTDWFTLGSSSLGGSDILAP